MGIFGKTPKVKKPPPPPSIPTRADARASLAGQSVAGFNVNPSLITNIGGAAGLGKARTKKKSLIGAT